MLESCHPEPRHCEIGWPVPLLYALNPRLHARYPFIAGGTVRWHREQSTMLEMHSSSAVKVSLTTIHITRTTNFCCGRLNHILFVLNQVHFLSLFCHLLYFVSFSFPASFYPFFFFSFIRSFIHPFLHLFIRLFIHSFIYQFIN